MKATVAPRQLGRWMCLALVMGNMIGSGIFLLPAALAPFGWNSVAGWLFTIAGVLAIVVLLRRLATHLPGADGALGYTQAAFGPLPAFLIGYSYWISIWVGNAAIALAAVAYLAVFVPNLAVPLAGALAAVGLVWLTTAVNLVGARAAGGTQLVTTLVKLVPLVAVIVLGAVAMGGGGRSPAALPAVHLSLSAVNAAAALSLWALVGVESATVASATIADADRVVPWATLLGTGLAGLLYLLAASTIILLMPLSALAPSTAPFADFVGRFWAHGPALLVAGFAAVSAIGALNGMTLLQGVVPVSLARTGGFPRWFATITATGTPARALVGSSVLTTGLVLLTSSQTLGGAFAFMALLATAVTLFLYLGIAVAALRLGVGGVVGGAATIFALWTFAGAGAPAVGWSLVLLASGVPLFWLVQR